jgi:hypothetical protein
MQVRTRGVRESRLYLALTSYAYHSTKQGRGEHTPRVNPAETGLVSIMRPASDGYVPSVPGKVLYDGPEGHSPCFDLVVGDVNTHAIVSGRRLLLDSRQQYAESSSLALKGSDRRLTGLVSGKGWEIIMEKLGVCDGGYYSICGRASDDDCPALGHHDSRGTIVGNEYAGWVIFDIPVLQHGLIMLRYLSDITPDQNARTKGWSTVNNGGRLLRYGLTANVSAFNDPGSPSADERVLGTVADYPADFKFEYSINGKVTTLSKQDFIDQRKEPQRFSELITLLDEPKLTGSKVELAIRLLDCGRDCTIGFTHLYWA